MTEFLLPPIDYEELLWRDPVDLYSVDMGDGVRRCLLAQKGFISLPLPNEPEVDTLAKLLLRGAKKFPNSNCFGHRRQNLDKTWGPYEWKTYREFRDLVARFLTGLRHHAPWLKFQDRVGIFGKNQIHWVLAQYGIYMEGLVCVPIYDTFGDEAVRYIIEHAELSVIVVSRENACGLLRAAKGLSVVKLIIVMGEEPFNGPQDSQGSCEVLTMGQVLEVDGDSLGLLPTVTPQELCLILYTSGTTGMPKGVMISHGNLMATCAGLLHTVGEDVVQTDVFLSYLPLAHGFENALHVAGLAKGASCGFYRGDVRFLTEDAVALRPTVFCGVPRVYQRVQQVILSRFQQKGPLGRWVISKALRDQAHYCRTGQERSALWDFLVFNKVRAALGGRIRMFFTGAAPLSPTLQEFIKVCFGCPMYEGYGLTETTAVSHCCDYEDNNVGHVGPPLSCCEMKLESVPEMNYTTDDTPCPRGEVLIRGTNIMRGYYKEPALTKEVLDADGWFHSGDIGRFNKNGTLSIVDRKKNIFKLAQGEYIAVERLESALLQGPLIGQIFLYGNSYKDVLVAIVVPDPIALIPLAIGHGVPDVIPFLQPGWKDSFAALCKTDFAKAAIMDDIKKAAKDVALKGFEIPKAIHLEGKVNDMNQGFSVENDLLTATFKLRRNVILGRYQAAIDEMYAQMEAS
eukprot:GGOE01014475.1.p1 GENE.GGOE01014475.1~~GGOE01014475.1.p1  ORF type:complete len:694 (+),score=195.48 GGOE01014475.1:35-2083(+)